MCQLLAQGLLAVEGDYGTPVLTKESYEVLSQRRQVMLRRERNVRRGRRSPRRAAPPTRRPPPRAGVRAAARPRAAAAKEQGVPAT